MIEENEHIEGPVIEKETPHSIFHREVTRWFKDEGDLSLRLNYDLNENSKVLDIGGFKGNWASDIYSMYMCNVFVFEPVKKYFEFITERFKRNTKIHVENFGLSGKTTFENIVVSAESSSMFIPGEEKDSELIILFNINEFLQNEVIIDLVKINIEGSEYDLLDSISNENIKKLKNIQVQFHTFIDDCETRKKNIRERLSLTHECTYCYEYVWENWKLKE
jgi:FkbM family methyltransferase